MAKADTYKLHGALVLYLVHDKEPYPRAVESHLPSMRSVDFRRSEAVEWACPVDVVGHSMKGVLEGVCLVEGGGVRRERGGGVEESSVLGPVISRFNEDF